MKKLIAMTLALFAGCAAAFSPVATTSYAVLIDSKPISGITERINCALGLSEWLPGFQPPPNWPVMFNCIEGGSPVKFQVAGNDGKSWQLYTANKWYDSTVPGSQKNCWVKKLGEVLVWDCYKGRTGAPIFTSTDVDLTDPARVKIRLTTGGCGIFRKSTETSYDGYNQWFGSGLNCSSSGSVLTVMTTATMRADIVAQKSTIGSDGCSAGDPTYKEVFKVPCGFHDACLTNPWKNQSTCDNGFYDRMDDLCWDIDFVCKSAALTFFTAVAISDDYYVNDQKVLRNRIKAGAQFIRYGKPK